MAHLQLPHPTRPEYVPFHLILQLQSISIWEIARVIPNEEAAITAAYAWGLIPDQLNCPGCGSKMTKQSKPSYKLGFRWRCRKTVPNNCRDLGVYFSPLHNTFFERAKLPILTTLRLIIHFYLKHKVTDAAALWYYRKNGCRFLPFLS